MNSSPSIATVIVNWNKVDDVLKCLDRVRLSTLKPQEIIVVDNASSDESVSKIRYRYPNVTLLEQATNTGGTGGFNTGMSYALAKEYEFIWLLDNDALPGRRFLYHALATFKQENVALVGAQILDIAALTQTVELGAYINWYFQGTTANLKEQPRVKPNKLFEVDYVPICCALVKCEAIKHVGLMDSAYFLHWDDMDWGWRFKKAGYKVVSNSSALAWHKSYAKTLPPISVQYYDCRNILYFYSKHSTGIHKMYILTYGFSKRFLSFIKNVILGRTKQLKMVWGSMVDFINKDMGKNRRVF